MITLSVKKEKIRALIDRCLLAVFICLGALLLLTPLAILVLTGVAVMLIIGILLGIGSWLREHWQQRERRKR